MDLDLSQNSIGDRGLKVLCGALMGNVTLKRLNMRETKLGATSGWVDPLCEVMSAKKNLTALDLSDNLMGRDGVTAISQALHAPACQLASLHLNLNPLW